jgi:hypothetical protein
MMSSKTKAILSLASAFILGFACCFFLFYFSILPADDFRSRDRNRPPDFVAEFTRELRLDSLQVKVLRQELDRVQQGHNEIRKHNETRYKALRDEFRQTIAKALTPEQLKKYEEFNRRRDERRRR